MQGIVPPVHGSLPVASTAGIQIHALYHNARSSRLPKRKSYSLSRVSGCVEGNPRRRGQSTEEDAACTALVTSKLQRVPRDIIVELNRRKHIDIDRPSVVPRVHRKLFACTVNFTISCRIPTLPGSHRRISQTVHATPHRHGISAQTRVHETSAAGWM